MLIFLNKKILSKKKVDMLFVENEFLKENIQIFYKGKLKLKIKKRFL